MRIRVCGEENDMPDFPDNLTGSQPPELLFDEQVFPSVVEVIEKAEKGLVLVSPYNDYSVPLRHAVEMAARRVRVVAVCRKEQQSQEKKHFDWLTKLGAEVILVERLHSKIYANESQAILTSMNLVQGSAVNSREIALRVTSEEIRKQVIDYINERLISASSPLEASPQASKRKTRSARTPKAASQGHCIRCGRGVAFNLDA